MTGIVSTRDPGPPPKNSWGGGDGNWRWLAQLYNIVNGLCHATGISKFLDSIGSTRGSILYRGASGWAILTPGAAGSVLESNGAGADPSWVAETAEFQTPVVSSNLTVPTGQQWLLFKDLSVTGTAGLTLVGDLGVM